MSSFTGVSIIAGGKHCTTAAANAGMDSGYHLLAVKDYSRTVQEIPNGEFINSGSFMVGGHQWCIEYYPNGDDPSCADFISLYVRHGDDDNENHVEAEAQFEFSFVDQVEKQNPTYIRSTETYNFSVEDRCWGYEKLIKRDALERSAHLKEDCFTIRCDIMVCNDLSPQQDALGKLSDIRQHFKTLLQDKVGSDVTFEVSNETFPAHRCVLAARSKVFKAQLFGPMTEGTTSSVIQIKDMEAKVFADLLSFIYTDSFPNQMEEDNSTEQEEGQDEEEAKEYVWLRDLLVAADRYDIQQLKFLCEKQLSEIIGVGSVASTLALAEQHHCHVLKEACLKFIQVQSLPCLEKVIETDGWEHVTTTYPSVLKEIIAKIVSHQKNDKKRKH